MLVEVALDCFRCFMIDESFGARHRVVALKLCGRGVEWPRECAAALWGFDLTLL
jgi:hypothetical protein